MTTCSRGFSAFAMSQDPLKELLPTISRLALEVLLSCWSEARKIPGDFAAGDPHTTSWETLTLNCISANE